MTTRRLRRFAAILLAALLLASPAFSPAADNAAAATDNVVIPIGNTVIPVDNAVIPVDNAAAPAASGRDAAPPEDEEFREPSFGEEPAPPARVSDPIEPFNRAMFVFNDKAYYWVVKPVAKGYNYVVNEDIRVSVRNFFSNLATPARVANNLLQGEIRAVGTELLRFFINSTTGILGLFDTARDNWGIRKIDTDLGLTLGKYGLGHGMYIVLPVLGPTSIRDGLGSVGDSFLDPVGYVEPWEADLGLRAYRTENDISLRLGMYEELTGAAVDPYIAVRDAYVQNRAKDVRWRPFRER